MKKAFTLAEVLIALVVIGIITAITIPTIYNHFKWKEYKSGVLKAIATLNQASILWHAHNGTYLNCSYPLVGGTSGLERREDCVEFYDFYKKVLNIQKICNSHAYKNGCIPKYEGNDTVYMSQNEGITESDAIEATKGCSSFNQSSILQGKAFITTDGMIFFPYQGGHFGIIAVDVNGFKAPNKWGHDIHTFMPRARLNQDPQFVPGGCNFIEKGGIATQELLYKK